MVSFCPTAMPKSPPILRTQLRSGLGWFLCVGTGVGLGRVDAADSGRPRHAAYQTRHNDYARFTHAPLGTRQQDRHARSSLERARDSRRRPWRDRYGLRRIRRSDRSQDARRVARRRSRHSYRPVARPAVQLSTASTITSRKPRSIHFRRPCSSRAFPSGWSAHGPRRNPCSACCAMTACCPLS